MGVLALKMRCGLEFWCIRTLGATVEALHTKSWHEEWHYCFSNIILQYYWHQHQTEFYFSKGSFLSTFLPPFWTCMSHAATTQRCEGTLNLITQVILSVVTEVTWTSSAGRFLIGWGSFLEGESLLGIDERGKEGEQGWNQRIQTLPSSPRKKREYTYEDCLFLLLILSTSTVIVIPIRTPAASNKAITLMTSPVAICGKGFSAEKRT